MKRVPAVVVSLDVDSGVVGLSGGRIDVVGRCGSATVRVLVEPSEHVAAMHRLARVALRSNATRAGRAAPMARLKR